MRRQQLRIVFSEDSEVLSEIQERLKIESASSLLLARSYLELENRDRACVLLQRCLREDPFCFEALDILLKEHLMSRSDLELFLSEKSLKFPSDAKDSQGLCEIARFLYQSKLHTEAGKLSGAVEALDLPSKECSLLSSNLCVRLGDAECLYYSGHFRKAYEVTKIILDEESFYWDCIPLHISLLVELGMRSELFLLSHKLVDFFPDQAVSWYSVGAYYFLLDNQDAAKKFLVKMTGIRPTYGPGWLLLGHSFAAEQEHDQAINCYLKATKLLSGSHLPLMYIGVEYGLSQNLLLCEKFLNQAHAIAPNDPFVLNELGVLASKNKDYDEAVANFFKALDKILDDNCSVDDVNSVTAAELEKRLEKWIPKIWEPLLTNLGSAFVHLDPKKAVVCHGKAFELAPEESRVMGNLGLAYLADLDLETGIHWLHRSLSLRSETVYSTLLSVAMEKISLDNSEITVLDSEKDKIYFFQTIPTLDTADVFRVPKPPKRKKEKETGSTLTRDLEEGADLEASRSLSGIEIDMDASF